MEMNDMILMSVDDHIIEPPDMFDNHLPAKYKDDAPQLVHGQRRRHVEVPRPSSSPTSHSTPSPDGPGGVRPGARGTRRDPARLLRRRRTRQGHERRRCAGSMNFRPSPVSPPVCSPPRIPISPGAGTGLQRLAHRRVVREHPGRFIPMGLPVIWDAELCAGDPPQFQEGRAFADIHRKPCCTGLSEFPLGLLGSGLAGSRRHRHGDVRAHRVIGQAVDPAVDSPPDVMITLQPMNIVNAAADLLWSAPIKKYKDLKIALSEGGTGWIPYFLERVDRTFDMHSTWTLQNFGGKLPSEVFREHFLTCFISDPLGVKLRHEIGVDNISWEMDYPHSDSMWPNAPEELWNVFSRRRFPTTDQQDHLREHHEVVQLRPVQTHPEGAVHRRGPACAGGGSRRSIRALSHHQTSAEENLPRGAADSGRRRAADVTPQT